MNKYNSNGTNPMFITPDEQQLAVLGQSYLRSIATGDGLEAGTCVLTNKRLYFKGTCYTSNGKGFIKTSEDTIVDVKDITASGFSKTSNFLLEFLAIITCICAMFIIVLQISDGADGEELVGTTLISIILVVILSFIYSLSVKKLYVISFAGGKLAFKATSYSTSEISNFQRMLRLVKDGYAYGPTLVQVVEKSDTQENTATATTNE